jgi:hypothetical protein
MSNKLLIFTGEIPENPYPKYDEYNRELLKVKNHDHEVWEKCKLSILNQCVEVENEVLAQYVSKVKELNIHDCREVINTISQFIQSEIKKQEKSNA